MKLYFSLAFFIFSFLDLSAQCTDYQSELENVESNIINAIKDLTNAQKANTLEDAQRFIDKAIPQIIFATKSANLAKEYSSSCGCYEGKLSATNIYNITFDCSSQAQKAADCGILGDLKYFLNKSLIAAKSAKELTSEGTSYCLSTD